MLAEVMAMVIEREEAVEHSACHRAADDEGSIPAASREVSRERSAPSPYSVRRLTADCDAQPCDAEGVMDGGVMVDQTGIEPVTS